MIEILISFLIGVYIMGVIATYIMILVSESIFSAFSSKSEHWKIIGSALLWPLMLVLGIVDCIKR